MIPLKNQPKINDDVEISRDIPHVQTNSFLDPGFLYVFFFKMCHGCHGQVTWLTLGDEKNRSNFLGTEHENQNMTCSEHGKFDVIMICLIGWVYNGLYISVCVYIIYIVNPCCMVFINLWP